jgi:signal peptidase II
MRRRVWALLVVVAVLAADQASKAWAIAELSGRSIELAPTVSLALTYNDGISFSLGAGFGPVVAWLVAAVAVMLVVAITRERSTRRTLLYAVILGGALGNLADRALRGDGALLSGHVIDFVDVSWFAVFNVADSAVVLGCISLFLSEYMAGRRGRATADSGTT